MQERGLKFVQQEVINYHLEVAPYAGAWIEIMHQLTDRASEKVAPYAGAWIEIRMGQCSIL